jgi:signal transduction histidine kinase
VKRTTSSSTGRDKGLWPVLLLLLVVVLVPTAGVLWFMNKAVENERFVVRQKLAEAYRGHLSVVAERLDNYWKQKTDTLDSIPQDIPGSAIFARCIRGGLADSVICYDGRGRLIYPAPPLIPKTKPYEHEAAWNHAGRLERQKEFVAAAAAYEAIANSAKDRDVAARALQAQARCFLQAGQADAAIKLVTQSLDQDRYRQAADPQGRLIVADAELMVLELLGRPKDPRFLPAAERLKNRLLDYGNPALGAAQRRFLMKRLQGLPLPPDLKQIPTLDAEDLAARYVESHPSPSKDPAVRPTDLPGVWQLVTPSGRIVALFHEERLLSGMRAFLGTLDSPTDVTVALVRPDEQPRGEPVFHSLAAGPRLPGWRLTLALKDQALFESAAHEQIAAYLWIGGLIIAAICGATLLMGRAVRRQMRLARLRNDLVATVTHELKTPLSSIRLLVDTLLDEERSDPQKVREYLQLVAKENTRLSHLIDNFLAFSRMERNKRALDFREVQVEDVVNAALEAVRERFSAPGCRLEVRVAAGLPPVFADSDALVTVILNLLDNAYKYSGAEKQIVLRAYAENGAICLKVEDNGIGLSQRDTKKVFKRFYQVDRRLSRSSGGVGLGLSIVEFIVAAHGGKVRVASRLGHGSTFTVAIPCAAAKSPAQEEAMA